MTPRVVVLLATYNGVAHLAQQVDSILAQEGVEVRLVVSDDGSTEGTLEWLRDLVLSEPRVSTLPIVPPSGSAARNFYRLLRDAELREGELIAFSDQDDIWLPHKLATQARLLEEGGVDAVSGSVTAFHADGRRRIVKKDYPQRRLDYLTEGPGPGCTFLMTPRFIERARRVLAEVPSAGSAEFHDSLLYAIGRARGWGWHIEGEPLVDYRQHDSNVFGANQGVGAATSRFGLMRSRWHRGQAVIHAEAGIAVADDAVRDELAEVLGLLRDTRARARWSLARRSSVLRRRPRDRFIIGAMIRLGL